MDPLTILLLLALGVVIFQVIRRLRGRANDADELWDAVSPRQRMRFLIESTPMGYQEVDLDGIIRQVNSRETDLTGLSQSQLVGMPFWELFPETDQERERMEFFRKVAEETAQPVARKKYQHPATGLVTLEVHENLLRDEGGRVVGMAFASLDISERQRSEEAAYQTASELKALFEAFPDYFLKFNAEGIVTDCQKGSDGNPFVTAASAVGSMIADLLPREAHDDLELAIERVSAAHSTEVLEYQISRLGVQEHWELRLMPLHWSEFIAVIRNITKRRADEEQLRTSSQELERKNRELEDALLKAQESTKLKSRFLANMSHEIRTPINGVIGMTDFLLSTSLDPEQREYTESLKSSADSLLTVLNDILDISKIEAGKLQIESIPFDLEATLDEVSTVFSLRARGRELDFDYLPMPRLHNLAVGDPGRLRQVLNNLLSNAVKFTDRGKVSLHAELVRQSPAKLTARFSVIDTGIGISVDQQRKLFSNFVQVDDSTTRKYGGTGLGLAISKQLVELMGGRIGLESRPGHGSTFWFTIVFGKQAIRKPGRPADSPLNGLRVLVVDRKSTAGPLVKQQLPAWKCDARAVHHGRQVVPALKQALGEGKPVQLALIDLELAKLDRLDVAAQIKNDPDLAGTQLIAMTSSPMRGDGIQVHKDGYAGYVVKPCRPDDLRGVIAAVTRPDRLDDAPLVTRHTVSDAEHHARVAAAGPIGPPTPPAVPPGVKPVVPAEPKTPAPEPPEEARKCRALVAEDNLVNQKITSRLLQKAGLDVDVVDNGKEAVDAWRVKSYDVVFMDCQMPEMDGFEATAAIRRLETNGDHIPICALTAHAMKTDRDKCLASGMDHYLSKPVDFQKLRDTVEKLVLASAG